MSETVTAPCIKCGTPVTLSVPSANSECVPVGHCPKCGTVHYVSYSLDGGMQVSAASKELAKRVR
jgi:hypothetical protein